ncbi:MAG: calcium/sodium antiporter [Spirochaetales bacterium]|nr:calcium/sodium antiporter [Spirochaetales bacterium]
MGSVLDYVLLVLGFVLLIKGADFLIDGAVGLARRVGVSDIVVGLTVIAFGTSLPELVVNVMASLQGKSDLAVGNVIGSNTANILLILGVSSLVRPLSVQSNTIWKEIPFALLAVIVMGVLANDRLLAGGSSDKLALSDGIVLLAFFIIFLFYVFGLAQQGAIELEDVPSDGAMSVSRIVLLLLAGFAGIILGGDWIVDGAVTLGRDLGVSEAFIGLTVLALGTSLPELAASAAAALKGKVDLAIGNVVGSNIFNIFLVLGTSATISAIDFHPDRNFDVFVSAGAALLLMLSVLFPQKNKLGRLPGVVFLGSYLVYVFFVVGRG